MRRVFFLVDNEIRWAVFETVQEGLDWCKSKGYRVLNFGIV